MKNEDTFIDPYKNIDLNKILGEDIYPDEKIIYVAKMHWIVLFVSLILLSLFLLGFFVNKNFNYVINKPILLVMPFLSICCIILYFKTKIILTNRRYILTSRIGKKSFFYNEIVQVKSSENIIGSGTLYLEHSKYPNKLLPSIHMVKNVKKLELKFQEQLNSIAIHNKYREAKNTTKMHKFEVPIIINGDLI